MPGGLDAESVRSALADAASSLEVRFHPAPGEGTPLDEPLSEAAGRIEAAAGGDLLVRHGGGEDCLVLPALTLRHEGCGSIHYHAAPDGPEEAPFLTAVVGPHGGGGAPSADRRAKLDALDRSVALTVFMGAACPHCPHAVGAAIELALASPRVRVAIVDAQIHEGLAARYAVRSVPQTLIDEGIALTGVVTADEVLDAILERDAEGHVARLVLSLVEQGRFGDVIDVVKRSGGPEAFAAVWRGHGTSTRIGLMMVVETALGEDAASLDVLVPVLIPLLSVEDATVRGDTADVLGQIGHADAVDALKCALDDPNEDVAEIAAEALESIAAKDAEGNA